MSAPGATKTRLHSAPEVCDALSVAFARDVIEALSACPSIAQVTVVSEHWNPLNRESVLPDPGQGLNEAIRAGLAELAGSGLRTAVFTSDLPTVTPDDVSAVLAELEWTGAPAFVPDASARGTTSVFLDADHAGRSFQLRFGRDSARAHHSQGAVPVGVYRPRLRLDVDSWTDLETARAVGLGRHSAAALARITG